MEIFQKLLRILVYRKEKCKVRFRHCIQPEKGNPFTLAYENTENIFEFGVEICSKRDRYSRPMGRKISASRLATTKTTNAQYEKIGNYTVILKYPALRGTKENNYWIHTKQKIREEIAWVVNREIEYEKRTKSE